MITEESFSTIFSVANGIHHDTMATSAPDAWRAPAASGPALIWPWKKISMHTCACIPPRYVNCPRGHMNNGKFGSNYWCALMCRNKKETANERTKGVRKLLPKNPWPIDLAENMACLGPKCRIVWCHFSLGGEEQGPANIPRINCNCHYCFEAKDAGKDVKTNCTNTASIWVNPYPISADPTLQGNASENTFQEEDDRLFPRGLLLLRAGGCSWHSSWTVQKATLSLLTGRLREAFRPSLPCCSCFVWNTSGWIKNPPAGSHPNTSSNNIRFGMLMFQIAHLNYMFTNM